MQQRKQDLILDEIPEIRHVTLNLRNLDASRITLLDALDIARVSGISADRFGTTLASKNEAERGKLMYAFAWVIARRIEPDLTWEEMCTYQLDIMGSPPSKDEQDAEATKARAIMNVVQLAHVTPDVAEQMTLAQVDAVLPRRKRRG